MNSVRQKVFLWKMTSVPPLGQTLREYPYSEKTQGALRITDVQTLSLYNVRDTRDFRPKGRVYYPLSPLTSPFIG